MKILLAASEVVPIIKIGGLGDVIGSLPLALEKIGVKASVVVPYFPSAKTTGLTIYKSRELSVPFNNETHVVEVYKTKLPNSSVDVYLLKNNNYFGTGGVNFYAKSISETEMFIFFDRVVVEFVKSGLNQYDLVHCNDWHTGMITHLLEEELGEDRPATLFTIHNLMYQGLGNPDNLRELGIAPGSHPLIDWDILDGDLNMVQQGITSSDYINAVSPNYAKEILTEKYGGFLADILQSREGRLTGILNGLDYSMFPRSYSIDNWHEGKALAKQKLITKLGLKIDIDKPIYSYIGRIDRNQKGIELIYGVIPEIINKDGAVILLGTGDKEWESKLQLLQKDEQYSASYKCITEFDIELANMMYSGSDFLLVPSKYEPCGLIQLIALWYGCLPIVHDVGGLKDTITDGENGLVFHDYTAESLSQALTTSFNLFKNRNRMDQMIVNAMKRDYSWGKSALEYKKLYEKIVNLRKTAHE
jgi:starch synthase